MPQHDFDLANQSGPEFRADVTLALKALASVSSGATAPATTYAYQWWADTASGLAKQRNATNSAWLVRGTLAETIIASRSSNTALAAADYGMTIKATGTFTQTFAAASTIGAGWSIRYRNEGTGVVIFDPSGAETIDGRATIGLYPGEGCVIVCDGAGFSTFGRSTGNVYIGAATASNSAWLSLAMPAEFTEFEFACRNLVPATNNVSLAMQFSVDGGSSWVTSDLYTYVAGQNLDTSVGHSGLAGSLTSHIELANAVSSSAFGAGVELSGTIHTGGGSGIVGNAVFAKSAWLVNSDAAWARRDTFGNAYNLGAACNAFRVLMTSGNIASGSLRLWGRRK